jgi:hypothetical protein
MLPAQEPDRSDLGGQDVAWSRQAGMPYGILPLGSGLGPCPI